jgi:hypothetical protein
MIIKKNSWHCRFWKKLGGGERDDLSLCSYVQHLFWGSLMYGVLFAMLAVSVGDLLYGIGHVFYYHTAVAFMCLGSFVLFAATVFGIFYFFVEYLPNRNKRLDKEPGIFGAWWQAKKDKMCPLIDFED